MARALAGLQPGAVLSIKARWSPRPLAVQTSRDARGVTGRTAGPTWVQTVLAIVVACALAAVVGSFASDHLGRATQVPVQALEAAEAQVHRADPTSSTSTPAAPVLALDAAAGAAVAPPGTGEPLPPVGPVQEVDRHHHLDLDSLVFPTALSHPYVAWEAPSPSTLAPLLLPSSMLPYPD